MIDIIILNKVIVYLKSHQVEDIRHKIKHPNHLTKNLKILMLNT